MRFTIVLNDPNPETGKQVYEGMATRLCLVESEAQQTPLFHLTYLNEYWHALCVNILHSVVTEIDLRGGGKDLFEYESLMHYLEKRHPRHIQQRQAGKAFMYLVDSVLMNAETFESPPTITRSTYTEMLVTYTRRREVTRSFRVKVPLDGKLVRRISTLYKNQLKSKRSKKTES